jgi:hypothetical protein
MLLLKLVLPSVITSNKEIKQDYKLNVYNVKRILDLRVSKKKVEYLVK